jgi:nucleotide-binding universal stress UspA family protein
MPRQRDAEQEDVMIDLKNILVATDFSDASNAALNYGRALARHFDAGLHVVHVVQNLQAQAFGDGYIAALPELQADLEEAARRGLAALLIDNDEKPLRTTSAVVRSGMPAAAIVEYANTHGIDIIVMGTHGGGALAHLLMGSVAERVVRTAPCPVLTVRHPEHEFVLPDALTTTVAHG